MSGYYILNMTGCRLGDDKMATISHPKAELLLHTTAKTVQSGAILGAGLIGPLVAVARGQRDRNSVLESSYTFGRKGVNAGLVLGPALWLMHGAFMDKAGAYDRAYRLRYSKNQCFVDRLSLVGAVAGVGAASYLGAEMCKGAIFGAAGGCVLAGILNSVM